MYTPVIVGDLCEYMEGICDSHPCENQGRCLEDGLQYSCVCTPPFTGQYVLIQLLSDINPCIAQLFVFIFHQFKAGIADAIFSFK